MPNRIRSLTGLALSLALLAPLGCAPSARPVASASDRDGGSGAASGPEPATEAGAGKTPTPPPPERPPTYDAVQKLQLENGPVLCASRRPDLAQTFVSLQIGGNLSPEELLLLREWIQAAWRDELGDEQAAFQPPACESHFLCLAGSKENAEQLAGALFRALSAPGSPAFYRVRAATLKNAEDWDRSSADWKLNTAARAVRSAAAGMTRLQNPEKLDPSTLLSLVDRSSGAKKARALPLYSLEKRLSAALLESTITVSGPAWKKSLLLDLKEDWTPRKKDPKEEDPLPPPSAAIRLEKDAPELTQAALVWELPPKAALGPIETALALLAVRWEERSNGASRVRLQNAGGLYSLPALRIDGPHEKVLAAISGLSEEYDRLISTYGSPSEKEWQAAKRKNPARGHFEPRCQNPTPAPDDASAMTSARDTLRAAGIPTIVVWGTDTAPEPSE